MEGGEKGKERELLGKWGGVWRNMYVVGRDGGGEREGVGRGGKHRGMVGMEMEGEGRIGYVGKGVESGSDCRDIEVVKR